jgi:hypothetical protein
MAEDARAHAAELTLDRFGERVREILERQWGVELKPARSAP